MTEPASTGTPAEPGQEPGTPQPAGGQPEQPNDFHQDSFDSGYGKASDKSRAEIDTLKASNAELQKQAKTAARAAAKAGDAAKTAEELNTELESTRTRLDEANERREADGELFGKLVAKRMEALPEDIRALAPGEGTSPAVMVEWLNKAEAAAPKTKPKPQGGELPDGGGLKLDPKIYDPARGGSVASYKKACAEYTQAAVDAALDAVPE